jgi:hypothetical protein
MAKKFLTGLTLVNLDSDPLAGSEGELYFNTSASVAKIYKAGNWSVIGEGAGGGVTISETAPSSPNTGDLWYEASTGSLSIWDGTYWVEINSVIDGGSGAGIIVSTTAPEDPETGTGWYNNETGVLAVWDGTYWVDVNGVIENPPISQEEVQDYIAPLFDHNNHNNISAVYDDINNEIILSASASGAGTGVTISETAPEGPQIGDGWYNNASGSFYLYDGSYWVEVNGIINGLTEDQVQDYASSLFIHDNHTNVTATYDDENAEIILNTSGSLVSINSITYPDYITFDTSPENEPSDQGSIWWNQDFETLSVQLDDDVTLEVGQEHVVRVKNASGSVSIPIFTLVMFAGSTGDTVTATPAITSDVKVYPSDYILGITAEEIPADGFGFVTQFGFINKIDTSSYPVGTILYPDPNSSGAFVTLRPSAPAWQTPIAAVTRQHENTGRALVRIIPGIQLNSVENVEITSPGENHILIYNNSSSVWVNAAISDIINDSINPFLLMGG